MKEAPETDMAHQGGETVNQQHFTWLFEKLHSPDDAKRWSATEG